MKKLKLSNASRYLNYKLQDDETETGGVSHVGETLREFLEDAGMALDSCMADVDKALVECGIKPVDRSWHE